MFGISTTVCCTTETLRNDELLSITAKQCKLNPGLVTTYKTVSQKGPSGNGAPEPWLQVCQPSRKQEAHRQPVLGTTFTHSFHYFSAAM